MNWYEDEQPASGQENDGYIATLIPGLTIKLGIKTTGKMTVGDSEYTLGEVVRVVAYVVRIECGRSLQACIQTCNALELQVAAGTIGQSYTTVEMRRRGTRPSPTSGKCRVMEDSTLDELLPIVRPIVLSVLEGIQQD